MSYEAPLNFNLAVAIFQTKLLLGTKSGIEDRRENVSKMDRVLKYCTYNVSHAPDAKKQALFKYFTTAPPQRDEYIVRGPSAANIDVVAAHSAP